jgi:hypothetical protein
MLHISSRLKLSSSLQSTVISLRDGIHQIVSKSLVGVRYLCQQIGYLVASRIFLIAMEIGESLGSYQEYPAKSVGKQGEELLIATLLKS